MEDRNVGRAAHADEKLLRLLGVGQTAREIPVPEVQAQAREVIGGEGGHVVSFDGRGQGNPLVVGGLARELEAVRGTTHEIVRHLSSRLAEAELGAVRTEMYGELRAARVDLGQGHAGRERLVELHSGHESRVLEVAEQERLPTGFTERFDGRGSRSRPVMDEVVEEELRPGSKLPALRGFGHLHREVSEALRRVVPTHRGEQEAVAREGYGRDGSTSLVKRDREATQCEERPEIGICHVGGSEHLCDQLLRDQGLCVGGLGQGEQIGIRPVTEASPHAG